MAETPKVILRDKDKAAAILELHKFKGEHFVTILISLLDILVDEVRKENDTVNIQELPKNQGKIEAFLQLKTYVDRGLPDIR